eukprot:COSAG02_NODE_5592_length_4206_cov_2.462381_2_plen_59_part_00
MSGVGALAAIYMTLFAVPRRGHRMLRGNIANQQAAKIMKWSLSLLFTASVPYRAGTKL